MIIYASNLTYHENEILLIILHEKHTYREKVASYILNTHLNLQRMKKKINYTIV